MEQEYKRLTIKDWAVEDRPREKMLQKGIGSLSDAELFKNVIPAKAGIQKRQCPGSPFSRG